jgi:peptide/nickel transport system ATP-binding protein
MNAMVLQLRDLRVTYGSRRKPVPAVRGVTLELARGETLGIAGESGCGKSTMALAVLRLLPPGTEVTGEMVLNGNDVNTMTPGQLRAVRWAQASIIFQGAQHVLNPVRRIGWQISEALTAHDRSADHAGLDRRIGDLLELVGLTTRRADDFPHELSGGQKQRVLIAMALACEPDLIIADEPTTALDVMVQAQILQILAEIKRERSVSMLFISHDLSVLSSVADRVAVMYAGRIVEQGPAKDLLRGAGHPYSKALAAAFPTIGDQASRFAPQGLAGDPPDPTDLPTGCAFHPRCPIALASCAEAQVELATVADKPDHQAACILLGATP